MSNNRRGDIQGLRAIAVLSVIAFHFGLEVLQGGFLGVDVFFAISGYLIVGLLASEMQNSGTVDLVAFYGRRAKRLLPVAGLVTAASLIASYYVLSPTEAVDASKAAVASTLYVSNLWFLNQTFDYFSPESALNPFLHTWSLSVEEQFYFVCPWIVYLVAKLRKGKVGSLVGGMVVLAVLSFGLCIWLTNTRQPWAFYLSPSRAWQFALGGLAALLPLATGPNSQRFAGTIGWLGLGLLAASILLISENLPFPGFVAVLPTAAAVLILMSGANSTPNGPAKMLSSRPLQYIGTISYSLYLWHWPVIVLAKAWSPELDLWQVAACLILTFALAAASYHSVESPLRSSNWLARSAWRPIAFGAGLTLMMAVAAYGTFRLASRDQWSPEHRAMLEASQAMPLASSEGCLVSFLVSEPSICNFGSTNSNKTIVLFGDSHADQWSTALAAFADENDARLVTFLKSSCAVSDVPVHNLRLRRTFEECYSWRAAALVSILDLKPDVVLISQFSNGYVPGRMGLSFDEWGKGLATTLSALSAAGIETVVIRDTPTPGGNAFLCVSRAIRRGQETDVCSTPVNEAVAQNITAVEKRWVEQTANAHFVDLTDDFCPDTLSCPALLHGTLVYKDRNHISSAIANDMTAHLVPYLRSSLQ